MSDPSSPVPPHNRASQRQRVLFGGRIVYGPSADTSIDCRIMDISEKGARVRLAGALLLVDPIYLVNLTQGRAFRARQAWRRGDLLGLEFIESYDLREPPPELPRIIRQVWVEQTRA